MALTNHERVGKMLDLLRDGLRPFVQRELKSQYQAKWFETTKSMLTPQQSGHATDDPNTWDIALVLQIMWNQWNDVFKRTLGHAERSIVSELKDTRNKWAHQNPFSSDDTYRALDNGSRLLAAVSASEADEVEKMKMELLRVRFDEQVRTERRKTDRVVVESPVTGGLKAWREVVNPHKDVASGRYQQAEFAADLWQVHIGEGTDEYRVPAEFYRRTFLTESLRQLLTEAIRRIATDKGDPVVQLQTNFGGGKTHSMLALYHLFSGGKTSELLGVDAILKEVEVAKLPKVNRVVLVGNKISPGNPSTKADGSVVRTLWGEMAWQLGFAAGGIKEARKAYERVRLDDEKATSPGDVLRELFNHYGPSLILIDEWVAYARQLHDQNDLPAGTFETHFTFAQALTESAKLAKNCLLVISLPASDASGSPHTQAEDVEVGGERGRAALGRLQNAIGRVEASWRPASAEEGFEIVRRRLFEPLIENEQWVACDSVTKAFIELYRSQSQEFPRECSESDYQRRIRAAYPIHPEVFDRLYTDWSTLVKFQRTRGVLRLMAAVIHSLWRNGDRNPMILPSTIPIDDDRVQFELNRYLSDNWVPVIAKDVDGPSSLPVKIDGEVQNLGRLAASRRVARTIFLGSAPISTAANRGLEDKRVKLGCVMPGESPAIFGDALRRLSSSATFLYQDSARYWYSTQPTVTKLADDRAEQLKSDPDAVVKELDRRLRLDIRKQGDFARIHPMPHASQDVADDLEAKLVVLGVDHTYSKDAGNLAEKQAKEILETRGNAPRIYRNTLVFLVVDKSRLQDLDEATRRYLAWDSILNDTEALNLTPHQVKQAENQKANADSIVASRIPEAYKWLLVPTQKKPSAAVEWQAFQLTGQDALAVRASKKLRNDELLVVSFAGTRLRMELDRVPLWRGNHVAIKQVVEDFARYLYLPRAKDPSVIAGSVRDGLGTMLWHQDTFAYADSFDEAAGRYRGLRCGQPVPVSEHDLAGLLVRAEPALAQFKADQTQAAVTTGGTPASQPASLPISAPTAAPQPRTAAKRPKRYHGSVSLDSTRVGRDASRIADEVIAHLAGLVGAKVRVTLEIEAEIPDGAPDSLVRTVTENGRTLKFESQGFEEE